MTKTKLSGRLVLSPYMLTRYLPPSKPSNGQVAAIARPTASILGIASAPAPQSGREVVDGLKARGIAVEVELRNEEGRLVPRFVAAGGAMLGRDWEELRRFKPAILRILGHKAKS